MKARRGFTLIELMVVILIVAILAAVAIPIMRGRIDDAKWSEGKAMIGTIASALRAYVAETNLDIGDLSTINVIGTELGFVAGDLTGTYFVDGDFSIDSGQYIISSNTLEFVIGADSGIGITSPARVTLSETGAWIETP